MPDTRPGILFDSDGVCMPCKNYEKQSVTDWDERKNMTIEYYSSGPINTTITHAITGTRERGNLVGSIYEDLFFKVCIATKNQPITLFYYSPEEYEKHHYIQLSSDIKEKWLEK
jgi:hypothetical protein